jgi:hypothetical protein
VYTDFPYFEIVENCKVFKSNVEKKTAECGRKSGMKG